MLDGDAEPGGRPRRVRTAPARLAAGGAAARPDSPSLAGGGASPEVAASFIPVRPTNTALARAGGRSRHLDAGLTLGG